MSQPSVSEHLKALRTAGLVRDERRGRQVIYRARAEGLGPLRDWFAYYEAFWGERFDRMEDVLREIDQ